MVIPGGVGVAGVVLLVVLVIGVLVGRSKRRWGLLLVGIVVIVVIGFVITATSGGASGRADDIARFYSTALPPLVAFIAGWLCARGSWFARIVVIAAAALLLAAFPYATVGQATADLLPVQSMMAP